MFKVFYYYNTSTVEKMEGISWKEEQGKKLKVLAKSE